MTTVEGNWSDRTDPRKGARRRADLRRRGAHAPRVEGPRRDRQGRGRAPRAPHRRGADHVHHRPQRQLHERLRHRLRLLRLLPAAGRPRRGLPAPEDGHLQEGRGDARDRRHRRPHAGRAPSRPRDRLVRGSLPLAQGALPDPPARAVAAGDPAHRAPLEADRPGHADAAARRGPRLDPRRRRRDPRRPRPRDHRAEEDEDRGLARRHAPRAPAGHVDDRDDDVRPRRDARRAHRAHAPHPRAPGRDPRLPRVHLVDLPAGGHAARARSSRTTRPRSSTCSRRP